MPKYISMASEAEAGHKHCISKTFSPLSNLRPIFKVFALLESVWNLLQNPYSTTQLTLGMLLHYLGKLKIQIVCRYSATINKEANKMHLSAPILIRICVWLCRPMLSVFVFLSKSCPRHWIACWLLTNTAVALSNGSPVGNTAIFVT